MQLAHLGNGVQIMSDRQCLRGVFAAVGLGLLLLVSGGCGLLLTHGPPTGHEHLYHIPCTESNAGPLLDFVSAGFTVVYTVDEHSLLETDREKAVNLVSGVLWTSLYTASGFIGLRKTARCREARRLLLERLATAGQAGPIQAPVEAGSRVHAVQVNPGSSSIGVGDQVQLVARATDAAGMTIPNRSFDWTTSNGAIASVDPAGLVTAHAEGRVIIAANAGGVVGTAEIVVVRVPGSVALIF
jgi:hypothetical protein